MSNASTGGMWPPLVLLSLLSVACGDEAPPPLLPTFENVQQEIFSKNCSLSTACHGGDSPKAELNLEAPAHVRVVGKPSTELPERQLVVPGDPAASYLYEKLTSKKPGQGVRMPPGQPLSDEKLDLVRRWIEAGAPEE